MSTYPDWSQIERDPRFRELNPEERVKMFDSWRGNEIRRRSEAARNDPTGETAVGNIQFLAMTDRKRRLLSGEELEPMTAQQVIEQYEGVSRFNQNMEMLGQAAQIQTEAEVADMSAQSIDGMVRRMLRDASGRGRSLQERMEDPNIAREAFGLLEDMVSGPLQGGLGTRLGGMLNSWNWSKLSEEEKQATRDRMGLGQVHKEAMEDWERSASQMAQLARESGIRPEELAESARQWSKLQQGASGVAMFGELLEVSDDILVDDEALWDALNQTDLSEEQKLLQFSMRQAGRQAIAEDLAEKLKRGTPDLVGAILPFAGGESWFEKFANDMREENPEATDAEVVAAWMRGDGRGFFSGLRAQPGHFTLGMVYGLGRLYDNTELNIRMSLASDDEEARRYITERAARVAERSQNMAEALGFARGRTSKLIFHTGEAIPDLALQITAAKAIAAPLAAGSRAAVGGAARSRALTAIDRAETVGDRMSTMAAQALAVQKTLDRASTIGARTGFTLAAGLQSASHTRVERLGNYVQAYTEILNESQPLPEDATPEQRQQREDEIWEMAQSHANRDARWAGGITGLTVAATGLTGIESVYFLTREGRETLRRRIAQGITSKTSGEIQTLGRISGMRFATEAVIRNSLLEAAQEMADVTMFSMYDMAANGHHMDSDQFFEILMEAGAIGAMIGAPMGAMAGRAEYQAHQRQLQLQNRQPRPEVEGAARGIAERAAAAAATGAQDGEALIDAAYPPELRFMNTGLRLRENERLIKKLAGSTRQTDLDRVDALLEARRLFEQEQKSIIMDDYNGQLPVELDQYNQVGLPRMMGEGDEAAVIWEKTGRRRATQEARESSSARAVGQSLQTDDAGNVAWNKKSLENLDRFKQENESTIDQWMSDVTDSWGPMVDRLIDLINNETVSIQDGLAVIKSVVLGDVRRLAERGLLPKRAMDQIAAIEAMTDFNQVVQAFPQLFSDVAAVAVLSGYDVRVNPLEGDSSDLKSLLDQTPYSFVRVDDAQPDMKALLEKATDADPLVPEDAYLFAVDRIALQFQLAEQGEQTIEQAREGAKAVLGDLATPEALAAIDALESSEQVGATLDANLWSKETDNPIVNALKQAADRGNLIFDRDGNVTRLATEAEINALRGQEKARKQAKRRAEKERTELEERIEQERQIEDQLVEIFQRIQQLRSQIQQTMDNRKGASKDARDQMDREIQGLESEHDSLVERANALEIQWKDLHRQRAGLSTTVDQILSELQGIRTVEAPDKRDKIYNEVKKLGKQRASILKSINIKKLDTVEALWREWVKEFSKDSDRAETLRNKIESQLSDLPEAHRVIVLMEIEDRAMRQAMDKAVIARLAEQAAQKIQESPSRKAYYDSIRLALQDTLNDVGAEVNRLIDLENATPLQQARAVFAHTILSNLDRLAKGETDIAASFKLGEEAEVIFQGLVEKMEQDAAGLGERKRSASQVFGRALSIAEGANKITPDKVGAIRDSLRAAFGDFGAHDRFLRNLKRRLEENVGKAYERSYMSEFMAHSTAQAVRRISLGENTFQELFAASFKMTKNINRMIEAGNLKLAKNNIRKLLNQLESEASRVLAKRDELIGDALEGKNPEGLKIEVDMNDLYTQQIVLLRRTLNQLDMVDEKKLALIHDAFDRAYDKSLPGHRRLTNIGSITRFMDGATSASISDVLNMGEGRLRADRSLKQARRSLAEAEKKRDTLIAEGKSVVKISRQIDLYRQIISGILARTDVTSQALKEVGRRLDAKISELRHFNQQHGLDTSTSSSYINRKLAAKARLEQEVRALQQQFKEVSEELFHALHAAKHPRADRPDATIYKLRSPTKAESDHRPLFNETAAGYLMNFMESTGRVVPSKEINKIYKSLMEEGAKNNTIVNFVEKMAALRDRMFPDPVDPSKEQNVVPLKSVLRKSDKALKQLETSGANFLNAPEMPSDPRTAEYRQWVRTMKSGVHEGRPILLKLDGRSSSNDAVLEYIQERDWNIKAVTHGSMVFGSDYSIYKSLFNRDIHIINAPPRPPQKDIPAFDAWQNHMMKGEYNGQPIQILFNNDPVSMLFAMEQIQQRGWNIDIIVPDGFQDLLARDPITSIEPVIRDLQQKNPNWFSDESSIPDSEQTQGRIAPGFKIEGDVVTGVNVGIANPILSPDGVDYAIDLDSPLPSMAFTQFAYANHNFKSRSTGAGTSSSTTMIEKVFGKANNPEGYRKYFGDESIPDLPDALIGKVSARASVEEFTGALVDWFRSKLDSRISYDTARAGYNPDATGADVIADKVRDHLQVEFGRRAFFIRANKILRENPNRRNELLQEFADIETRTTGARVTSTHDRRFDKYLQRFDPEKITKDGKLAGVGSSQIIKNALNNYSIHAKRMLSMAGVGFDGSFIVSEFAYGPDGRLKAVRRRDQDGFLMPPETKVIGRVSHVPFIMRATDMEGQLDGTDRRSMRRAVNENLEDSDDLIASELQRGGMDIGDSDPTSAIDNYADEVDLWRHHALDRANAVATVGPGMRAYMKRMYGIGFVTGAQKNIHTARTMMAAFDEVRRLAIDHIAESMQLSDLTAEGLEQMSLDHLLKIAGRDFVKEMRSRPAEEWSSAATYEVVRKIVYGKSEFRAGPSKYIGRKVANDNAEAHQIRRAISAALDTKNKKLLNQNKPINAVEALESIFASKLAEIEKGAERPPWFRRVFGLTERPKLVQQSIESLVNLVKNTSGHENLKLMVVRYPKAEWAGIFQVAEDGTPTVMLNTSRIEHGTVDLVLAHEIAHFAIDSILRDPGHKHHHSVSQQVGNLLNAVSKLGGVRRNFSRYLESNHEFLVGFLTDFKFVQAIAAYDTSKSENIIHQFFRWIAGLFTGKGKGQAAREDLVYIGSIISGVHASLARAATTKIQLPNKGDIKATELPEVQIAQSREQASDTINRFMTGTPVTAENIMRLLVPKGRSPSEARITDIITNLKEHRLIPKELVGVTVRALNNLTSMDQQAMEAADRIDLRELLSGRPATIQSVLVEVLIEATKSHYRANQGELLEVIRSINEDFANAPDAAARIEAILEAAFDPEFGAKVYGSDTSVDPGEFSDTDAEAAAPLSEGAMDSHNRALEAIDAARHVFNSLLGADTAASDFIIDNRLDNEASPASRPERSKLSNVDKLKPLVEGVEGMIETTAKQDLAIEQIRRRGGHSGINQQQPVAIPNGHRSWVAFPEMVVENEVIPLGLSVPGGLTATQQAALQIIEIGSDNVTTFGETSEVKSRKRGNMIEFYEDVEVVKMTSVEGGMVETVSTTYEVPIATVPDADSFVHHRSTLNVDVATDTIPDSMPADLKSRLGLTDSAARTLDQARKDLLSEVDSLDDIYTHRTVQQESVVASDGRAVTQTISVSKRGGLATLTFEYQSRKLADGETVKESTSVFAEGVDQSRRITKAKEEISNARNIITLADELSLAELEESLVRARGRTVPGVRLSNMPGRDILTARELQIAEQTAQAREGLVTQEVQKALRNREGLHSERIRLSKQDSIPSKEASDKIIADFNRIAGEIEALRKQQPKPKHSEGEVTKIKGKIAKLEEVNVKLAKQKFKTKKAKANRLDQMAENRIQIRALRHQLNNPSLDTLSETDRAKYQELQKKINALQSERAYLVFHAVRRGVDPVTGTVFAPGTKGASNVSYKEVNKAVASMGEEARKLTERFERVRQKREADKRRIAKMGPAPLNFHGGNIGYMIQSGVLAAISEGRTGARFSTAINLNEDGSITRPGQESVFFMDLNITVDANNLHDIGFKIRARLFHKDTGVEFASHEFSSADLEIAGKPATRIGISKLQQIDILGDLTSMINDRVRQLHAFAMQHPNQAFATLAELGDAYDNQGADNDQGVRRQLDKAVDEQLPDTEKITTVIPKAEAEAVEQPIEAKNAEFIEALGDIPSYVKDLIATSLADAGLTRFVISTSRARPAWVEMGVLHLNPAEIAYLADHIVQLDGPGTDLNSPSERRYMEVAAVISAIAHHEGTHAAAVREITPGEAAEIARSIPARVLYDMMERTVKGFDQMTKDQQNQILADATHPDSLHITGYEYLNYMSDMTQFGGTAEQVINAIMENDSASYVVQRYMRARLNAANAKQAIANIEKTKVKGKERTKAERDRAAQKRLYQHALTAWGAATAADATFHLWEKMEDAILEEFEPAFYDPLDINPVKGYRSRQRRLVLAKELDYQAGGGFSPSGNMDARAYEIKRKTDAMIGAAEQLTGQYAAQLKKIRARLHEKLGVKKLDDVWEAKLLAALGSIDTVLTNEQLHDARVERDAALRDLERMADEDMRRGMAAGKSAKQMAEIKDQVVAEGRRTITEQFEARRRDLMALNAEIARAATNEAGKEIADLIGEDSVQLIGEIREQINIHTREIAARLESIKGFDENPKLQTLVAQIKANDGVWLHRTYEFFDNPAYRNEILEGQSERAKTLRTAAYEAIYNHILEQDISALMEGGLSYESARHQLTSTEASRDVAQKAKEKLDRALGIGTIEGVRNILMHNTVEQDAEILMGRRDVLQEIQDLWGVRRTIEANMAKSLFAAAQFVANDNFVRQVYEIGKDKWIFDADSKEAMEAASRLTKGAEMVKVTDKQIAGNPAMGVLAGKVVPKDFMSNLHSLLGADDVHTAMAMRDSMIELFAKGVGLSMWSMTAGSVRSMSRNFLSGVFPNVVNGNIGLLNSAESFEAYYKALKLIFKDVAAKGKLTPENRAELKKLHELGVIHDTLHENVIRNLMGEDYKRGAKEAMNILENTNLNVRDKMRKLMDVTSRIYGATDDVHKVVAYYMERSILDKAYGDQKTEAWKDQEAADIVQQTQQTYSRLPEWVKQYKKNMVVGMFVAFPIESARTLINSARLAGRELKSGNAVLMRRGARRMTGVGLALSAFSMLAAAVRGITGIDEEEERAFRETLDDWEKNQSIIILNKDEKGVYKYTNISYLNFFSYLVDPITHIISGVTTTDEDAFNVTVLEGLQRAFGSLWQPLVGDQQFTKVMSEAYIGYDSRGQDIYGPNATAFDKLMGGTMHVILGSMVPSTVKDVGRFWRTGETTAMGEVVTDMDTFLHLSGQRIRSWDPQMALERRLRNLSNQVSENRSSLNRVLGSRGSVSASDIERAYRDANEAQRQQANVIRTLTKAGRHLGLSEREIREAMANSGVANDFRRMARTNRYVNVEPSTQILNTARQRSANIRRLGGTDADRIQALRDAMAKYRKQEFIDD